MAITQVKEMATGASGSADGSDNRSLKVSYTSTYQVICSDPEDGPRTVLDHFRVTSSLPWVGRRYSFGNDFDATAICKRVNPSYIDGSGGMYLVTCEYSDIEADQQENGQPSGDPLQWRPEIAVSFGSYSKPVEHATFLQAQNADGLSPHLKPNRFLPITNSAGKPLNPTFEEEYSFKVIRFTTNVPAYDDDFFNKYQDTINKSEFTINIPSLKFKSTVAKHHGKLRLDAALNFEGKIMYWRRTIELLIRPWDRDILDQGMDELYEVGEFLPDQTEVTQQHIETGRRTFEHPIKDGDDMPASDPVPLDGKGKRLKEGSPPVSLVWRTFEEADFSQIKWV